VAGLKQNYTRRPGMAIRSGSRAKSRFAAAGWHLAQQTHATDRCSRKRASEPRASRGCREADARPPEGDRTNRSAGNVLRCAPCARRRIFP